MSSTTIFRHLPQTQWTCCGLCRFPLYLKAWRKCPVSAHPVAPAAPIMLTASARRPRSPLLPSRSSQVGLTWTHHMLLYCALFECISFFFVNTSSWRFMFLTILRGCGKTDLFKYLLGSSVSVIHWLQCVPYLLSKLLHKMGWTI